jgi:thymidylate synthase (FAD)
MIKVTMMDYMGSDVTVVDSARVSFGKKIPRGRVYLTEKDERLIKYLAEHRHMSPFGHCFATFHVKAPIFVARQLVKHKFLRWNEISRRYVDEEPEFYEPKTWRGRSKNKKQGSDGIVYPKSETDFIGYTSLRVYKELLKEGVAPEQARMVLPQSTMTEWYWSGSLDAFADMCILRSASDAQEETRHVSAKISDTMQSLFPISWKALTGFSIKNKFFDEYGYYGENNAPLIDLEKKNTIEDREFYGDDHIRPMNDEEKKRAMERKELNQVWYDGDGGELFE